MFDWMKFVILALVLLNSDDEEYVRSGISRYYYGVFGIIRRYLINVKGKYYLKSQSSDVHKNIFIELQSSDDTTENEISDLFNKLRKVRNEADYNAEVNIVHFKKFLKDYNKDLEIITDAIEYFKNHPNY
ncbi:MAG: hypothetical protein IJI96_05370 [Methanobrevibacter sp.]|nr:hypothetical protein [Methanobrevibacter sp.]MBQ6627734.1 hypothetical protein [Methanobrevibacter sp.]